VNDVSLIWSTCFSLVDGRPDLLPLQMQSLFRRSP
jgi:hypothetical protein